jgi:hypothetical protein
MPYLQRTCYCFTVPQDISDISSADQLIRYAVRAQLDLVGEAASLGKTPSHNKIAQAIGMDGGNLAHALTYGTFADAKLQKLDEMIVALAPAGAMHTGGLSSLAICLRGLRDRESLADRVPASWAGEILQGPADDEVGVLTQASALLSAYLAAEQFDKVDHASRAVQAVHERYFKEIVHVVDQLILLGYAPPTPRSVEALIVLGTLGGYEFDIVKDQLEYALKQPLGFRVWRVITSLVMLSRRASHTPWLRQWVKKQLSGAEELREKSLYPGRSLDLELAIRVPLEWSSAEDDWASAALLARANNPRATVRERGTAAMGLWQRAIRDPNQDTDRVAAGLAPLIAQFETAAMRQDAYPGMRWVAATLRHVITNNVGVCNSWPEVDEPWMQNVDRAVGQLEDRIPPEILPATKTLLRHSLVQNAGVYRRQAIEALVAGGWTGPVARALETFLELERTESWLRIRALFALGFLQHRDRSVQDSLAAACHFAYSNVRRDPTRAQVTEMHSALFAVGDCFGAAGVPEQDVWQMRRSIQEVLEDLINGQLTTNQSMFPVSRASAYLLTFMILPRGKRDEDLAEVLLRELSNHPDGTTQELSRWALAHRIDGNGAVRPLVHAEV